MFAPVLLRAFVLLTLSAAKPAVAASGHIIIWNERIAATVNEAVAASAACWSATGGALDHRCAARELNHRRDPFLGITVLDEIAFLVAHCTNVVLKEKITDDMKLEFIGRTTVVLDQEAEARLYFTFEW